MAALSNGRNITNHKGYDNQPFFDPSKPVIYYSSFNDSGRSDIKFFNYQTNRTSNLTTTKEREYSPTVTPDGKYISTIIQGDNGAQDLGKYPINGGLPEVLINDLKIGYHTWAGKDQLLLFVLGDSSQNTLHYYNLATKKDTILANNIGRSLHKIPGRNEMSFVQKFPDSTGMIKKFNLDANMTSPVAFTLKGSDHLAWLNNNIILMSDGSKLFYYQAGTDNTWQPVTIEGDISMLKGVARLAVSADNTKLAVVVSE
jgi:WD40-like Beta Propeller Repeat